MDPVPKHTRVFAMHAIRREELLGAVEQGDPVGTDVVMISGIGEVHEVCMNA